MGYDGKPIGLDLTIVTVVLQYGVFPSELNGTQHVGKILKISGIRLRLWLSVALAISKVVMGVECITARFVTNTERGKKKSGGPQ